MKNLKLIEKSILFAICISLPVASLAQAGSLDLSFGDSGIVTNSIGEYGSRANAIAIQADGKIVVAGESQTTGTWGAPSVFALTRYNTNGSLDNTFDTDGIVTTSIGFSCVANAIAIQADGKIVVAGSDYNNGNYSFALTRYNTNGSLDNTFDTDGIVTTSIGIHSGASAIAIQADGKIVVSGGSNNNGNSSFALTRYNTNGSLDNTFDTDGIVTTSIGLQCGANAIAIQADGKIVVAGFSGDQLCIAWTVMVDFFAVIRYNTNGSLDTTFGIGGIVRTFNECYHDSRANGIAIQADGKIVVAGYYYGEDLNSEDKSFALIRYNTNGSLDTTFGFDGIVLGNSGSAGFIHNLEIEVNIAIQADGKIVVARGDVESEGDIETPTHYRILLKRFNTNGSLDNTFDIDGIVTTSIGTSSFAKDLAIQADGKILVAGAQTSNDTIYEFTVVRYNNSNASGLNTFSNQNTEINIFPNPTTGNIYLSENTNIVLTDLSGNLLLKQINTNKLDISALPAGMYFLRVGENLKQIFKIIKE
jgi:uncharacterized delta-60 repeat protein